jgi:hypothetical protein
VKYNTYYEHGDANGENIVEAYLSLTTSVTIKNFSEFKSRMTMAATPVPTVLLSEFENYHFPKNKTAPIRKGHAVAQLVEALRYKPEGRGFDSRWCNPNFSLT